MIIAKVLAAGLMVLTVFVHIFMGGPEIMGPLREADLHPVIGAVMDVVWHGVSITLICMAVGLLWLIRHDNPPLLWCISGISLGFAVLFIWYGITQLASLWPMPQWTVFIVVPVLAIWGAGYPNRRRAMT